MQAFDEGSIPSDSTILSSFTFWGRIGFDWALKTLVAIRGSLVGLVKNLDKQTNATDNTDAILAEAEYIFNNADSFIVDEEYALAA